jgi:1-acyl-sn-glycerol-3-phosphate acyltransferase
MKLVLSGLLWLMYGVSFLLSLLVMLPVFLLTWFLDPFRRISNSIFMFFGKSIIILNPGWKRKILGLENYNPDLRVIYVANHLSFLDMPLMATLPWNMKWVSKKEIFNVPVIGWLMYMSGHIKIDRSSKRAMDSLKTAKYYLDQKIPVMIFPEGTRSRVGELKKFKRGAFVLAKEGNYQIQPIVIHGTFNLMKPETWVLNLRGRLILSLLPAIDPEKFEDVQLLQDATFNVIKNEIENLKIQENDGIN